MKSLSKYGPLLLILLAGIVIGQWTAGEDSKADKWENERKAILESVRQKQVEIANLDLKAKQQEKKIAKLEVEVQKGDEKVKSIETHYRKKLEAVAKYTPVQRDSFFYAKYPGQDTIRNVDSQKVIADLVRGEGQDSLNTALRSQVVTLKSQVAEQKDLVQTEQAKFEKQKEITGDMVRRGDSFRDEADFYQKRSKKFRRQRDLLGGGIIVVIILSIL